MLRPLGNGIIAKRVARHCSGVDIASAGPPDMLPLMGRVPDYTEPGSYLPDKKGPCHKQESDYFVGQWGCTRDSVYILCWDVDPSGINDHRFDNSSVFRNCYP
ncbi:hypothetical protein scyTo_0017701 [Scyliorhinus torazame]|uniref:Uncharacterized protein n=1 Tax=Scyliorhinus torazame TaxID=75743 RepID=A0A401PY67_SCYTO|nr:hypothetical protein [Scyliorhinus torazame]